MISSRCPTHILHYRIFTPHTHTTHIALFTFLFIPFPILIACYIFYTLHLVGDVYLCLQHHSALILRPHMPLPCDAAYVYRTIHLNISQKRRHSASHAYGYTHHITCYPVCLYRLPLITPYTTHSLLFCLFALTLHIFASVVSHMADLTCYRVHVICTSMLPSSSYYMPVPPLALFLPVIFARTYIAFAVTAPATRHVFTTLPGLVCVLHSFTHHHPSRAIAFQPHRHSRTPLHPDFTRACVVYVATSDLAPAHLTPHVCWRYATPLCVVLHFARYICTTHLHLLRTRILHRCFTHALFYILAGVTVCVHRQIIITSLLQLSLFTKESRPRPTSPHLFIFHLLLPKGGQKEGNDTTY